VGNIDRYPTYKGGKVKEVVVYANYIDFAGSTDMWSTSGGGHLMKVVNLTGFTVLFYNWFLVGICVSVLLVQCIYIILINILCNSRYIGYFIKRCNKYQYFLRLRDRES